MIKRGMAPFNLVRYATGLLVALHGLMKIIFISNFTDYVMETMGFFGMPETFWILIGSFLPFVEFFSGLMLLSNIRPKQSVLLTSMVMLVLSFLVLVNHLYIHLVFEIVVFFLLGIIFLKERNHWSGISYGK